MKHSAVSPSPNDINLSQSIYNALPLHKNEVLRELNIIHTHKKW